MFALNSAQLVQEKFSGKVPCTMDELLTLPGVARKTANVVLGNAYGIIEGIAVDTHVSRLAIARWNYGKIPLLPPFPKGEILGSPFSKGRIQAQ